MDTTVIKTYKFSLKPSVTDADFLDVNTKIQTFLSSLPGFQYRSVAKTKEGQWIDINYWENEAALEKVEQAFEAEETAKLFIDMVDLASMEATQASVLLSSSTEAA